MVKKKTAKSKPAKRKTVKQKKTGSRKNLHVARLEKKLRKISAHIKKCKEDLQSIIRLKQLQSQIRGK